MRNPTKQVNVRVEIVNKPKRNGAIFTVAIFFCPCRARSDGHKNVLSLIGYSHLLENR